MDTSRLSPRRQRLLECLLAGMAAKEIAPQLHVSIGSVKAYINELCHGLGFNGQKDLMAAHIRELEGQLAELKSKHAA